MRHLALIALLALFSIAARADEWSHCYPVTGKPEVAVNANDGDIEVHGRIQPAGGRARHHAAAGTIPGRGAESRETQSGNHVEIKLHKTSHVCFGVVHPEHAGRSPSAARFGPGGSHRRRQCPGRQRKGATCNLRPATAMSTLRDVEGSVHADTGDGNVDVNGRFTR